MGEASPLPTLLPPSTGTFTPTTPSGLTPNTRSEAEAALTLNTLTQTDSAAPTTPLGHQDPNPKDPTNMSSSISHPVDNNEAAISEAQQAYRCPPGPLRTSSTNYTQALQDSLLRSPTSPTNPISPTTSTTSPTTISSPTGSLPFPPPGQGVVPLHTGISASQADAVKKARPSGLSLGQLGRQQSWNEQDMKHLNSQRLMAEVGKGDAGYSSGTEGGRG